MNDSFRRMKVELVLQAAKNVLDDPSIDFDTPEGAKEALMKEIQNLKESMLSRWFKDQSRNLVLRPDEMVGKTTSNDDLPNLFLLSMTGSHDETQPKFEKVQKLFEEACKVYGYTPNKKGEYNLKGEAARNVLRYISEHLNDVPDQEE